MTRKSIAVERTARPQRRRHGVEEHRRNLRHEQHLLEVVEVERPQHLDAEQQQHERPDHHRGTDHERAAAGRGQGDAGEQREDRDHRKHVAQQVEHPTADWAVPRSALLSTTNWAFTTGIRSAKGTPRSTRIGLIA